MRYASLAGLIVLGLAWAAGAAEAPAQAPQDPLAETRRLLAMPVEMGFQAENSTVLLARLQAYGFGLRITIDADAAEALAAADSRPVLLARGPLSAGDYLDLVLGDNLIAVPRPGGVVHVVTRETHLGSQFLATARYPVTRLLTPGTDKRRGTWPERDEAFSDLWESSDFGPQDLIDLITRLASCDGDRRIAAWSDEGGPANIQYNNYVLTVFQTPDGHAAVTRVLALLARGIGVEPEPPVPPPSAAPPANPAEDAATAALHRLLAEPVDVDFEDTPLPDALRHLAGIKRGLTIVVDRNLADHGFHLEKRTVSLRARRIPAGAVLGFLLEGDDQRRKNLHWKVASGHVLIHGKKDDEAGLTLDVYPVGDLLIADSANDRHGYARDLMDIVMRVVSHSCDPAVAAWNDEGGPAAIQYFRECFIVSQTPAAHAQVRRFLSQIRTAEAYVRRYTAWQRPPGVPAVVSGDTSYNAMREALRAAVDVDFQSVPREEAVERLLTQAPAVAVAFCRDMAPKALKEPVTLRRRATPRSAVLAELLGEELAYEVRPGYVVVTQAGYANTHFDLVLYPVCYFPDVPSRKGLYGATRRNPEPQRLIDRIRALVNPARDRDAAAWSDEGGPASIQYMMGCLLVTQTPEAHRRISVLLQKPALLNPAATEDP